jgi:hypothetical protein
VNNSAESLGSASVFGGLGSLPDPAGSFRWNRDFVASTGEVVA